MKPVIHILLFLSMLLPVSRAEAQVVLGARAVGLGQAATALYSSEWALFGNTAMMNTETRSISFFGIRYYGFSELTDIAAAVNYPTRLGIVGVGVHRYGFELFNESRIRIGYKNSYQRFHYGAAVNYNHVAQGGGYGSAGTWGMDVGIATELLQRIWIGARATNINQPAYGKTDEQLPRELGIGFLYRFTDGAFIISELVKDVRFPISYRGGVEVTMLKSFRGRAGFTTEPTTFSGGVGFNSSFWNINIVVQNHQDLGLSPGFDLAVKW